MKTTRTYKGEYEVTNNGQTFIIQNMEICSVTDWDGDKFTKWAIWGNDGNDLIANLRTKKQALNLIATLTK